MKHANTFVFLAAFVFISQFAAAQNSNFASTAGQEAAFNKKYKLTASIDNDIMLKWSTNASVNKAVLTVLTKEQLLKRKGTDHSYPYTTAVSSYQWNLNAPAYKDYHAYWIKVYTTDGLWQEYLFVKKENKTMPRIAPGLLEVLTDEETKNAAGETVIQTNINCDAGKKKVIDALKAMDGVFEVKVDTKTGKLTIKYSSDGTPYTEILNTVLSNGFNAGTKKSTNESANNCKGNGTVIMPVRLDPNAGNNKIPVSVFRDRLKNVKPIPNFNTDNATAGESFTLSCSKKTFKNCSLSFSNASQVDNDKASFKFGSGATFINLNTDNGVEEGYYFFEVTVDVKQGISLMIENSPSTSKESITPPTSGKQKISFMQKVQAGKSAVKITSFYSDWKFYDCTVTKIKL